MSKLPSILILICVLLSAQKDVRAQHTAGNTIEQHAYDYFMSKLDEIRISDGGNFKLFNIRENKIYFSGISNCRAAINIDDLYRYKKGFTTPDTPARSYTPHYGDTTRKEIRIGQDFVVKEAKYGSHKITGNDIGIRMTNRFFCKGYYYIRIIIDIEVDWIANDCYIKLDASGHPLDYLMVYAIE